MNVHRKKVLLVDDSKTILLMERMILGGGAYELSTALDGEEGVEKPRAELPDLTLMAVVMPPMNGFEACRCIRSGAATAAIPVIMVTTPGEIESVAAGYESGRAGSLVNPLDAQELLAKVQSYLGGGSD